MAGESIKRGDVDEFVSDVGRGRRRLDTSARLQHLNATMKFLLLALAVALLFTAGSALDCHRCVSKKAGGTCELTVETCSPEKDACAAAKFLRAPHGQYQKCMALESCEMLKMNAYIDMKCCSDDMCNTFDNSI